MLDLIITTYELTTSLSSYLQEYIQYPVDYTYNPNSQFSPPSRVGLHCIFLNKEDSCQEGSIVHIQPYDRRNTINKLQNLQKYSGNLHNSFNSFVYAFLLHTTQPLLPNQRGLIPNPNPTCKLPISSCLD